MFYILSEPKMNNLSFRGHTPRLRTCLLFSVIRPVMFSVKYVTPVTSIGKGFIVEDLNKYTL